MPSAKPNRPFPSSSLMPAPAGPADFPCQIITSLAPYLLYACAAALSPVPRPSSLRRKARKTAQLLCNLSHLESTLIQQDYLLHKRRRTAYHPVTSHRYRRDVRKVPMTVVIGMMAETTQNSNAAIPTVATLLLCADTLATYQIPKKSPVTSHPSQAKIYPLAHGFFAAFCDDYYWSHKVATELNNRLLSVDFANDGVIDLVKVQVEKSFDYAFKWYARTLLKKEVGITLDQYYHDKKLRPKLHKEAQDCIKTKYQEMPAELVIAGQTHRGPLLLKANAEEIREYTNFCVSGGPEESVISWLKLRDQRSNMSAVRSLYHMVEAKRFVQTELTVGQKTQIVILRSQGLPIPTFQDDGITTMKTWFDMFCVKDTSEMDGTKARASLDAFIATLSVSQK